MRLFARSEDLHNIDRLIDGEQARKPISFRNRGTPPADFIGSLEAPTVAIVEALEDVPNGQSVTSFSLRGGDLLRGWTELLTSPA